MKFLSSTISKLARMRLWRIENWSTHPEAAQREVLQHLVTAAQYTEFGRKYNFSKLLLYGLNDVDYNDCLERTNKMFQSLQNN